MITVINSKVKSKLLSMTLLATFIYSFFLSLPLYNSSTYLANIIGDHNVYSIYIASALLVIVSNLLLSKLVRKYHSYKTSLTIVCAGLLSTLSLSLSQDTYIIILSYIIYTIVSALLFTLLNIFVDEFENEEVGEGKVRGLFLMLNNIGILFGALISGLIINVFGFQTLWLVTCLILLPLFYIFFHFYKNIKDPKYKYVSLSDGVASLKKNHDTRVIFITLLYLESFFALMVILTPLYLFEKAGINIATYSSVIIPIILLPFIILPYTLGRLADRYHAEKDLLITGVILIAIVSLLLPFIYTFPLIIIILALFISRIGAATVETMSYSYFFKTVNKDNILLITLFSNIRSFATLITSLISFIIINVLDQANYIFYIYAAISLYVLYLLTKLKTKY